MDRNKLTVQATLDTSQLKKDLDNFKGTVDLQANTRLLEKQVEIALKNVSKNKSITLNCGINGMDSVTRQIGNAVAQLQNLKQTAYSLPSDLMLNVSVNSQRLQQYATQLEHCLQMSAQLNTVPLNQGIPKVETASNLNTSPALANNNVSPIKEATTASKGLLDTLTNITSIANTPLAWFSERGIVKGYKGMGEGLSKSLD